MKLLNEKTYLIFLKRHLSPQDLEPTHGKKVGGVHHLNKQVGIMQSKG
jgi:hypothetical protein